MPSAATYTAGRSPLWPVLSYGPLWAPVLSGSQCPPAPPPTMSLPSTLVIAQEGLSCR
ncbi:Uncharacterised protein [Bordetella pertussis]|nr:Uncharacterised protein [Bordetella pertussis]